MTTSNKSDSLQRPEGRGFSPTLLMTERPKHSNEDCRGHGWIQSGNINEALGKMVALEREGFHILSPRMETNQIKTFYYTPSCVFCVSEAQEITGLKNIRRR